MDKSGRWKSVPPMFEGAQVFQHALRQKDKSREIEFVVLEDGPIIMAASWTNDGPRAPEWYDTHTSRARMAANGWEPIDVAIRRSGARDDEYVLYRKMVRQGETYKLHTRRGGPPLLVVPAAAQRAAILAAKPPNSGAELVAKSIRGARRQVAEPTPPQVLLLDTYEIPTGGSAVNRGLVAREIIRQAVLLAGREELKLQTRDATLGEQFPNTAAQSNQLLGVVPFIGGDAMAQLMLFRGSTEKPEVLWYRVEACTQTGLLEELVTALEGHSRNSLVEALRDSGFKGQAVASHESGPVGEDIERNLRNMTFPEQFRAVRSLHQLIRDEGASPQRLSALARAYANLGLLTEVHWNAAHAAYKARALLYAQRMQSLWPEKPQSYWTRGYVRTLVGRHAPAIADFERSAELLKDSNESPMPGWVRWAKAACDGENDLYSVGIAADGTEVARLLSLVQLEQFIEIPVVLEAAQRVLEVSPDCFRAVEVMAGVADLEARDAAAAMGPQLADLRLYERLIEWDDLPDSIKELIRTRNVSAEKPEYTARIELIDALNAAGSARLDTGEPSFGAIASLLEELTFLHVRREVQLVADWHHALADELLQVREPLVRNPAYRAYLQLYSADRQKASEALEVLPKEVDRVSLSCRNMDLLDKLFFTSKRKLSSELGEITRGHLDPVLSDLWFVRQRNQDQASKSHFAELLSVCPNAPAAVIASIRLDWKQIGQQQADDLKRRYWDVPPVLFALAKQHRSDKDWPRAVALLKRHIKLLPDVSVYQQLAEVYLEQGDLDRWKATFDEFLTTQPEQGLDHTHVRGEIALKLRGYRRWQEALPYAEAAAESGEGWALILAGSNHEALQHWDEAEAYYRRCSERYSDAGTSWYYFCRRTGQGYPASALPVDDLPIALAEMEVLAAPELPGGAKALGELAAPVSATSLAELYRQQDVEVPILTPRDGPIAALDPDRFGPVTAMRTTPARLAPAAGTDEALSVILAAVEASLGSEAAETVMEEVPLAEMAGEAPASASVAGPEAPLVVIAERAAWVRVYLASGTIIFEQILERGETWSPPEGTSDPMIWAGNSGSVYVRVGDELRGPLGSGTRAVRDVVLTPAAITERYAQVEDVPEVVSQAIGITGQPSVGIQ